MNFDKATNRPRSPISGVVTVSNWLMGLDGETYLHFFNSDWKILTDNTFGEKFGLDKFRSTAHWQLVALGERGTILLMIPGCQVSGFLACVEAPNSRSCLPV